MRGTDRPIPRKASRSRRLLLGASGLTLAASNSMNKKVNIERRRTWGMETWLFGLSLVVAGFVMGLVLMALLVATHRTDLR